MDKIDLLLQEFNFPIFYLKVVFSLLSSYLIVYYTIPTIIKISRRKNLMDEPGQRSSHERKIPNLGGVAMFFAIAVCASIYAYQLFDLYKFLFASLVILLYVGVMDDIVVMRAYKKLLAQLIVTTMLVIGSDVRIRNLFGVFGVYELNYFLSVIFSIITFIILVNAFNLIDGIDGLAGTYCIICFAFFGISYYRLGEYNYPLVILSTSIIGAVLGFLYYNFSERTKKIFMGDTGSMLLGFLLTFTAISFLVPGQERATRLRASTLGDGYDPEDIKAVIAGERPIPEQPVSVSAAPRRVNLIVDIQERLRSGKGAAYARWAKVYNLKQMAATLQFMQEQNITEYDQLSAKAEDAVSRFHALPAWSRRKWSRP
jgi:UDP-N-acetylmuramyl pentapeptide phosphotransferase/UDP-N-acetylglucosamine-1-phosphate transferase